MLENVLLSFIPVFVAVDALGILPIFVSLTHHLKKQEKSRIIVQSLITAACLAVGFIFLGKAVFRLLGITVADFMVAGGTILFTIAIIDIISREKKGRVPSAHLGAVPLGTPLIVGPAVLATSLLVSSQYGILATLVSVILNILLAGLILSLSDFLIKVLGEAGAKALSKITSLFLAAIAVMLVRKGIVFLISQGAF